MGKNVLVYSALVPSFIFLYVACQYLDSQEEYGITHLNQILKNRLKILEFSIVERIDRD